MKTIQILIMFICILIYGTAIFAQDSKGNGMVNDPTGKENYVDTNHMKLYRDTNQMKIYPDTNKMKIYPDTNKMKIYPDTNHIKRYEDTSLKKINQGNAPQEINRAGIKSTEFNQKIFGDILLSKADKRKLFYLNPGIAQLF